MAALERFAGRRALVTGGSRGIGAAIARRLAAEGADVVINFVANQTAADDLVAELTAGGTRAFAVRADVSDSGQAHGLVERAAEELGGLDVVASNAGIEHFGSLESLTLQDFDRVFHTNVTDELVETMPGGGFRSSTMPSAEDQALQRLGDGTITAAMRALPAALRATVYSADVEGYRCKEIAAMMHTPIGTVMSRLHRGRQRLRALLVEPSAP